MPGRIWVGFKNQILRIFGSGEGILRAPGLNRDEFASHVAGPMTARDASQQRPGIRD